MICELCPRCCGALRTDKEGAGFCAMPETPMVARAALHFWEEPCISGTRGSGAVFFSGCCLGCVFCQNREISIGGKGKALTVEQLRAVFGRLESAGAHNINLVSPTQFALPIAQALTPQPTVPVVWNTGGYERVSTLAQLEGKVQIYLPDLKYCSAELSARYSGAKDYFAAASAAILEMYRQVGAPEMDGDGVLQRGVLIRHMMLPGCLSDTKAVIDWVSEHFRPGRVLFSLMSQYTPIPGVPEAIDRRVTAAEYRAAAQYLADCGITDGFLQERTAAAAEYTPPFDFTGL